MRVLKTIHIEEISFVGTPAQQGARAIINKSADQEPVMKEAITEEEVVAEMKKFQHGDVSEARAREMAVANLAKKKGIYDDMFVSQKSSDDMSRENAVARVGKSAAEVAFNKHVEDIKKRDKCTGTIAMDRARKEHPAAFEAMQSA